MVVLPLMSCLLVMQRDAMQMWAKEQAMDQWEHEEEYCLCRRGAVEVTALVAVLLMMHRVV